MSNLCELVKATADSNPDKIAVVFGDDSLTYAELDFRSDQLATHLTKMGVAHGNLVGIYIERSLEMIVGLLGTLKSGGAYVPLDPAYPADRIAYMLEDSQAAVVLTQASLVASIPSGNAKILCLDNEWPSISAGEVVRPVTLEPDDSAYVIYTSGSTGRPKGVEIPHRALTNFLISMAQEPGLTDQDKLLAVTTLSFDIAGLELYLPLVVGAQLVIASRAMAADGTALAKEIDRREITVMQATPATWRLLLEANWSGSPQMRILCGGEALTRDLAEQLLPICSQLWNLYGPTETTIWSTLSRVQSGSVSIGHPILNTDIHILDDKLKTVPTGTPGELFIGGQGLAKGYFKQADLTAERFIPHPFDATPGARLYRTGDLAKITEDGSLEHLGRVDFQVKVRGFRIELGEIEAALEAQESVRQAAVLAREDTPGEKRLVVYFIPAGSQTPNARELRNALAVSLPDYMVPGIFVPMDSFPMTPNGKVDRNAFHAPDPHRPELADEYLAPRDEKEEILAAIWAEVLRLEQVGINDNFFELGGDSLKMAQVATRIREKFKVDIALRSMFENPTVGSLTAAIAAMAPLEQNFAELPILDVKRGEKIPLAFAQERVWFIHQLNPENLAYNFISFVDFKGALKIEALEAALGEILRRHESYRTSFPTVDGGPVQVIHPYEDFELPVIDLRDMSESEQDAAVKTWSEEEFQLRFDLAKIPMVRWHLMRYSDEKNALVHMEHHLVHDGWSFNIFLVELVELYKAFADKKPSPFPELAVQFAEFATWQREWMQGPVSDHQLAYWKEKFRTIPPILELPTKGPRPSLQTFQGSSERPEIPLQLCNDLRALSRAQGSTMFMTMLSGFIALLHRYTGETDVGVGTFFANRRARESEGLIGMILNNVVVRTALEDNPTARELIVRVRDTVLEDAHYQDVPFDRVVDAVQPRRDMSANPLFQVMFSFHDEPMPESVIPGVDVKVTPVISNGSSKFDLGVIGIPHSAQVVGLEQGSDRDGLTMIWEFSTDLFERDTISRMIQHYICLLEDMVANPDKSLSELNIVAPEEMELNLVTWNSTEQDYRSNQCLHQLIEAQVASTPDNIAVVFESTELSYRQLDFRANQLANFLQHQGLQPGALVGVCLERSEQVLISLLAVLKAGATYVPMDPDFPADRLNFMLEDAEIPILVTEGDVCDCLESDSVALVRLDSQAEGIAAEPQELLTRAQTTPDDLAYVIFTSGSTGRPKGVQVSHKALVNFLETMTTKPGISEQDRLYAVTTISFDIAGLEMYLPLINGARVIMGSRATAINGEELAAELDATGATIMQATPTTWQLLIESGWTGRSELTALCGGEALPRALAEQILPRVKSLWNMYGPTETTIWSTIHKIESGEGNIPIGRPIGNTGIYILDAYDKCVPVGVSGELCIGGDGLAEGYLKRPDLTAQKFVSNPVASSKHLRIYRTGDLARYRPDGTLECLGRTDQQIKLRGYRIELGEIESLLDRMDGITQSAVIVREDQPGNKRLVAYAVCRPDRVLAPSTILAGLRENLPEYMVPASCVILEEMPLTPNAKIDRLSLPAPRETEKIKESSYVAPRTELEQTLTGIWEKALGVSQVGVCDDFFDVGGHSMLAVRLVSEIESVTGTKIPVAALLQGRTIEYVANTISGMGDPVDDGSGLILLQSGGGKPPLFMIGSHPRYTEIPRNLGDDQTVYQMDMYALLSQRKAKGLKPFKTIPEYANYYIEEIRKLNPTGPYNLGGGCEGAYLAYEIALQLQQQGEQVNFLAMWIPPPLKESKGLSLRRYALWQSLLRVRYLITGGVLQKSSQKELKILLEHEKLEYRILQAICSYQPRSGYEGDITLIRTEQAPFKWKNDINKQWIDRASRGAKVHVVRGSHETWLYDYLGDLTEVLKNRLNSAAS